MQFIKQGLGLLALIFIFCSQSFAEHRNLSALRSGMSRAEVLSLLGPPAERQEFEIKREEAWKYKDVEITFGEDRVLRWYNASQTDSASPTDISPPVNLPEQTQPQQSSDLHIQKPPVKTRERQIEQGVLDEILRALPSEDGPKA